MTTGDNDNVYMTEGDVQDFSMITVSAIFKNNSYHCGFRVLKMISVCMVGDLLCYITIFSSTKLNIQH